ncbi:MAG TPA: hypothetical protein VM621_08685 [Luteibacter sp.]|uniref:hypothetical protein n=1 Tax=Luteibacter sp. TaxID=1886636 RepID=UPI002B8D7970|nr:hypothetical protein [Luteibacter sp.]HVI55114.1 hypothetical protein [Luteibacter sp.]
MNRAGLRYTALRLATLHPADRDWLLERLPVAAADALRALGKTPGLDRLARVADSIEPPREPAETPVTPVTDDRPLLIPRDLDPTWAALWAQASGGVHGEGPMPARLRAALTSWVPPKDVDA